MPFINTEALKGYIMERVYCDTESGGLKKKLSWALYQTWKWCDSVERAERKEE